MKVVTDEDGMVTMEFVDTDTSKIVMTAKDNVISITYTDALL